MYYTSEKTYEFISKQTNDPILERQNCRISGTPFPIFQSDKEFYDKISPTFNGKKYQIPFPTLCPEERQRRRLLFRNERKLYKRICDATNEFIISMYSPEKKHRVYHEKYRWSDKRDAKDYGINFDTNQSFCSQFAKLVLHTPVFNLSNDGSSNINSDFVNQTTHLKDSYLVFDANNNEAVMYGTTIKDSHNCIDCMGVYHCSVCYEAIQCVDCHHVRYSQNCNDSSYLIGCKNCVNCHHCYYSSNLINAKYIYCNQQLTKEEYESRMQGIQKSTHTQSAIDRAVVMMQCEQCFGNNITNSLNCLFCEAINEGVNLKYCSSVNQSKDSQDYDVWGINVQWMYECITCGENAYKILFCSEVWGDTKNMLYSHVCYNCTDCFGCVGLKNKQYCIFNKQYTKEQYEQLVPKIIIHMQSTGERGEFFHPSLSPFCYNETVAQEYFPLTREEAIARGYQRQDKDYPINIPEGIATVQAKDLPVNIDQVDDSILSKAIICEISGKPFRIIKPELIFYRKHKLPIPRKHPDIRHQERLKKRPKKHLHLRNCDNCRIEMVSVYPENHPNDVFCEKCYKHLIIG